MKKLFVAVNLLMISASLFPQLPQINLVELATGYFKPLDIKTCGDQRLFVVEQNGYIRVLYKDGTQQTTPFLDISNRVHQAGDERGLLGLAFSPNYKQDGFFYLNYTDTGVINSPTNTTVFTRISRFSVLANDSTRADPNSEVILLEFAQPYENHNGGNMMFGPDGYLYISQGDGGLGFDPLGNGQNKNTYHGKMLRIDVTGQTTYVVPPTNPFVGVPNTKPEIWAYGLRNPWRCSFDKLVGDMWIGDVGQQDWEEIDFQAAASAGGENYGWSCREGLHACPSCNQTGCSGASFIDPIYEIPSTTSCSITGGYVYRGTQYGKLFGAYLFTDYCSGNFWSIRRTGINNFIPNQLTVSPVFSYRLTSFGEDDLGELYLAYRGRVSPPEPGKIYRLVETTDCSPVAFISLSDSTEGCSPVHLTASLGDSLSYQWYDSSGAIGAANSYEYAVEQSGWYKVKVSKQQPGCEALDSIYVNILDSSAITLSSPTIVTCTNSSDLDLSLNVSPSGGVFSGRGVSGTNFINSLGNTGSNAITYFYTNSNGCNSEIQFTVVLNDTTEIIQDSQNTLVCVNESPFSLDAYLYPLGGNYSGSGVTNNAFDPAIAGLGTSSITYSYVNAASCESRYAFDMVVDEASVLTENITDSIFCIYDSVTSIASYVSPAGGTFAGSGIIGTEFDPSAASIGNNLITYSYSNLSGCISQINFNAFVSDTSFISRNSVDTLVCITEPLFVMTSYMSPVGGDFSGNGVTGSSFNPSVAGAGTTAITYVYTNVAGCESRFVFNLQVGNETVLTQSIADSIYCNNESPFSLNGFVIPSGGNFSGTGVTGGSFDPSLVTPGVTTISYEYVNNYQCVSTDSFQLRVDNCTEIMEIEEPISFSIFPNPGSGDFNLNVSVSSVQRTELSVTDVTGKMCFRKDILMETGKSVVSLRLPHLAAGVYSVQLRNEKGSSTKTLVIE